MAGDSGRRNCKSGPGRVRARASQGLGESGPGRAFKLSAHHDIGHAVLARCRGRRLRRAGPAQPQATPRPLD